VKAGARSPSGARRASPAGDVVSTWNVLATSIEGRRDALLIALRRLGRFRPGGYRNVITGTVEEVPAFLDAVRTALARLIPVELTLRFDPPGLTEPVLAAVAPLLDRLAGKSFFVRLERRGLKGRVHSPTVEREIGDGIWKALAAGGYSPRVDFADPDVVLVIETLGDQAGLALADRALRTTYPFVRIR